MEVKQSGRDVLKIIESAGRRLAQMGFELGEGQFDGIETGAARRQVAKAGDAEGKFSIWRAVFGQNGCFPRHAYDSL